MKPSSIEDILPVVWKNVSIIFDTKKGRRLTLSGQMIPPNRERQCIRIIAGIYMNYDGDFVARVYLVRVESIFDITLSSS